MRHIFEFFRNLKSSHNFLYDENEYNIMISTDIKLKQMFLRKNLSESRKHYYIKILSEVYEITGKTPSELIVEAKEEEQPYLHN